MRFMGWLFKGNKEEKPKTEESPENKASSPNTPSHISFPTIPGVDTEKGIAMTGGTVESYHKVLSMFRKDAEERLQKFRFFLYEGISSGTGKFPEKHLQSLTTQIQALKSASGTIGAADVSAEAARLETAGKDLDLVFILDKLPDYVEHLSELVKNIRTIVDQKQGENEPAPGGAKSFLQMFSKQKSDKPSPAKLKISDYRPMFEELKEAFKSQNVLAIEQILEELNQKAQNTADAKIKEALEQISDQVLMTEFDSAIKTIDELINTNE